MTQPPFNVSSSRTHRVGPLTGVRVVDLTSWLGRYSGRLLADLGAEVLRPTKASSPRPVSNAAASFLLADAVFHEVGKHRISVGTVGDSAAFKELLGTADVLITSDGPSALRDMGLHPDDVSDRWPQLVHISVTPFGLTGPWADRPASDLTLLAAGGLLYLGGDPDRPPVRPWGEQSNIAASLHATIGGLIALLVQQETGSGQLVDASAQEAVAHSIENAVQYFDCEGVVRRRAGAGAAEAGTGLYRCRDGWIYVLTTMGGVSLGWETLVEWLVSEEVLDAQKLQEPRWQDGEWRRSEEGRNGFADIFERYCLQHNKMHLYEEGQARGLSISPVSEPEDLLVNAQLSDRHFFTPMEVDGGQVMFPGPPYRFGSLAVGPRAARTSTEGMR